MSKISLVYYSATGNTEKMAKAIEEGIVEAGGAVTVYKSNAMDKDAGDKFNGKKVYIFGSYGWGGGEYADNWKAQLEGFGATIVDMPILANEEPSDEELAQLKEVGKKLAAI